MKAMDAEQKRKSKKEMRKESKKRKLEALISLSETNDGTSEKKLKDKEPPGDGISITKVTNDTKQLVADKSRNATDVDIAYLRAKKRERQKATMERPVFFISDVGHDAELDINTMKAEDPGKTALKLNVQDIQDLMLLATIGRKAPNKTRWCKLMRYNKLSHSTVLIIDGLSLDTLQRGMKSLPVVSSLFQSGVVLEPQENFGHVMNGLFNVNLSRTFQTKLMRELKKCVAETPDIFKSYRLLFPTIGHQTIPRKTSKSSDKCSRTDLLLDPISMIKENYPFFENQSGVTQAGYKHTSKDYAKVTPSSPLFAIDCEMCHTKENQSELTRISIVDEDMNVLYDKLVKPKAEITDYLTQYSGITKLMLKDVTMRLEDVQQDVQKILPSDAILCGHSLNMDLHAMKMLHPYVIDTSVIYNTSGWIFKKPSLKSLASIHLGEVIQNGSAGHNPVEDSSSTMKLVLLKLKEGIEYGNVMMGHHMADDKSENPRKDGEGTEKDDKGVANKESAKPLFCGPWSMEKPQDFYKPSACLSFFKHTEKEAKKICVIGQSKLMDLLEYLASAENVKTITVDNNAACVQRTREVILENDLTFCHLDVNESEEQLSDHALQKLNKRIAKLYKSCAIKSLFLLLFPGVVAKNSFKNGFCMVKIKE